MVDVSFRDRPVQNCMQFNLVFFAGSTGLLSPSDGELSYSFCESYLDVSFLTLDQSTFTFNLLEFLLNKQYRLAIPLISFLSVYKLDFVLCFSLRNEYSLN